MFELHDSYLSDDVIRKTITEDGTYLDSKRNNNLAIVWRSDYKPLNYIPSSFDIEKIEIKFNSYCNYPYITNLYNKFKPNNETITYASIYIWDNPLKKILSNLLTELGKKLNTNIFVAEDHEGYININADFNQITLNFDSINSTYYGLSNLVSATLNEYNISSSKHNTYVQIVFKIINPLFNNFIITFGELDKYIFNMVRDIEYKNDSTFVIKYKYTFFEAIFWAKHISYSPRYYLNNFQVYTDSKISYIDQDSPITGQILSFDDHYDLSTIL